MKQVKRRLKQIIIASLILVMMLSYSLQPVFAEGSWGETKHIGKYYFRYNYSNERLYISTKKNSGYKKTPVDKWDFASNGKDVMFIGESGSRTYIKIYNISKKKVKKIKIFPKKFEYGCGVIAAKGPYVWIAADFKYLYRYSIKNKKIKLIKKNVEAINLDGQNVFFRIGKKKLYKTVSFNNNTGYNTNTDNIYTEKVAVYYVTEKGKLKLRKSLGTVYSFSISEDGKIYYVKGKAHDIYRINFNGKKKKLVASLAGSVTYPFDTYCYLIENDTKYIYKYKTGKKVRI